MFGRKIMHYKQWEMDHISTFIQTHANGGAILDMGCSTGHMVEALSNHFGANRIHGADIHIDSVNRNRKVFRDNQFHYEAEMVTNSKEMDFIKNMKDATVWLL